jgi:hypothetical protein
MRIQRLMYDAFRLEPTNVIAFLVRLAEAKDFSNPAITGALFEAPLPVPEISAEAFMKFTDSV